MADLQAGLTQQQGSFLPLLPFSFLAAQGAEIFLFSSNKTVLDLGFKPILNSFITKLRIPKGTLISLLTGGSEEVTVCKSGTKASPETKQATLPS